MFLSIVYDIAKQGRVDKQQKTLMASAGVEPETLALLAPRSNQLS
jgi:hypothetical protein